VADRSYYLGIIRTKITELQAEVWGTENAGRGIASEMRLSGMSVEIFFDVLIMYIPLMYIVACRKMKVVLVVIVVIVLIVPFNGNERATCVSTPPFKAPPPSIQPGTYDFVDQIKDCFPGRKIR